MPPKRKISGKTTVVLLVASALLIAGITYFLAFAPGSPFLVSQTESNTSTFKLISYVDGEDVSDFIELSVWIPDSNAEFDEIEDVYTWSNFEEEESSKDADDISIDLSDYEYVWVEVDPDAESVFQNNHYLITPAGKNYAFTYYVYHLSSDVNFGSFDNTTAPAWYNFTVATPGAGAYGQPDMLGNYNVPFGYDGIFNSTGEALSTFPREAVQENMTLVLDVPEYTHADTHVGSNWDVEQSDYDDYSVSEMEFMHDEHNWRAQAPRYVPNDDLAKNGEDGLYSVTNAFCIRWTYNTSVSTTDGASTMVNMTLNDDTPAEIVIDGTFIYMIWYETIDFENGPITVSFEYEEAHRIYATTCQSGRVNVPRGSQGLGAFTAYSTIGQ